MKVEYRESFDKDLRACRDAKLARQIKKLIMKLESARALADIPNTKKLAGGSEFYRVRIGDYRVGLIAIRNEITLVRLLHRKEIYRYFP